MLGVLKILLFLVIVIIIIIIAMFTYFDIIEPIYKYFKKIYIENQKKEEYKEKMCKKYKNVSENSKKSIYYELLKCKKALSEQEKVHKEEIPKSKEGKINQLIRGMKGSMVTDGTIENIKSKYGIVIEREYLDMDIKYLKKYS